MPIQTGCPAREPGLCGDRSPVGGQESIELRDRVAGHAPEHTLQVRERIDLHPLAARHETGGHRSRLSALVAAKDHPVAPPHRDAAQTSLTGVVIDRQVGVPAVPAERRPVRQRVPDRSAQRTLRQQVPAQIPFREDY